MSSRPVPQGTATWEVREGNALDLLRAMPPESVHCVVTSPPYWGLRDYGVAGQIGLERTPEEYVASLAEVFREVRRVLRDDGTLWLNLGDSYTSGDRTWREADAKNGARAMDTRAATPSGLKPKDLCGIPWRVAFALQQPYYAGTIRDERDRIWLAAMLDGEGYIYIHRRKKGQANGQGYERQADSFGPGLEIANTSERLVLRCAELAGCGSIIRQDKERRQPLYRWVCRTADARRVLRELYPYLVAKQQQARIAFGCPTKGDGGTAAWESLKLLHGGTDTTVDFPPPPSLHEPGFYLRSDVIWSKSNPMPESVRDRPTKAHEYVFLLAKSERYHYDADAIAEAASHAHEAKYDNGLNGHGGGESHAGQGSSTRKFRKSGNKERKYGEDAGRPGSHLGRSVPWEGITRNRRSVWPIATRPYPDAHFATFPPELPELCILAGCPEGGVVLDPFAGAGTTGLVALRLGRSFIGLELNPDYAGMARRRITDDAPLLNQSAEASA